MTRVILEIFLKIFVVAIHFDAARNLLVSVFIFPMRFVFRNMRRLTQAKNLSCAKLVGKVFQRFQIFR